MKTFMANAQTVERKWYVVDADGMKLGRLMKEQYGDSMIVFEGLKKALDPNGIMNPYKMGI